VHSALVVLENARSELALFESQQSNSSTATTTLVGSATTVSVTTTVRILLRPGRYVLREPITIDDDTRPTQRNGGGASELQNQDQTRHVRLEIETMTMPEALYPTPTEVASRSNSFSPALSNDPPKRRKGAAKLRSLLNGCRQADAVTGTEDEIDHHLAVVDDLFIRDDGGNDDGDDGRHTGGVNQDLPIILDQNMTAAEALEHFRRNNGIAPVVAQPAPQNDQNVPSQRSNQSSSSSHSTKDRKKCIRQATMVLRTRRHNEPLIRVRRGSIAIRNIVLKHISHGTGKYVATSFKSVCALCIACRGILAFMGKPLTPLMLNSYFVLQIFGTAMRPYRSNLHWGQMISHWLCTPPRQQF
jgi:hypothetical protein